MAKWSWRAACGSGGGVRYDPRDSRERTCAPYWPTALFGEAARPGTNPAGAGTLARSAPELRVHAGRNMNIDLELKQTENTR
jgi:hypothetical protein